MNSQIVGLRVASAIFGLMSLAHIVRVIVGVELMIGGHRVGGGLGCLAIVVTAGLSVWLWRLAAQGADSPKEPQA